MLGQQNCLKWAVLLTLAAGMPAFAQSVAKPNVLFIVVDDLNNALGAYDSTTVRSPNIDRIARNGVRFDRAYVQYPLCNPSRVSFLSGHRPETTRVMDLKTQPRAHIPDAVFLPELFRKNNYFVASVGKVFNDKTQDDAASWDLSEYAEPPAGSAEAAVIAERYQGAGKPLGTQWKAVDSTNEELGDGIVARRVSELMRQSVADKKPFFLAAGFRKPHLPWVAPRRLFEMYPPQSIDMPRPLSAEETSLIPQIALKTELSDATPPADPREAAAAYYANITLTDEQVGVLLKTMDDLKLWENTIVVLFGDNGFHLGDHSQLWGKSTLFEQSARIPLVISGPGVKRNAVSPRVVELLDLYPTLAEMSKLPASKKLEGKSIVPLLRNPQKAWGRPAYTTFKRLKENVLGRSVRTERWRYTEWNSGQEGRELYDHESDPNEYKNLINDSKYKATAAELKLLLDRNKGSH